MNKYEINIVSMNFVKDENSSSRLQINWNLATPIVQNNKSVETSIDLSIIDSELFYHFFAFHSI